MSKTQVLYSRAQDGAVPITVVTSSSLPVKTVYEAGGLKFFSARQLLIALTGHPGARNWTFDRYFKTGKYTPPEISIESNKPPEGGTVIDLFGVPGLEKNESLVRARGGHFFPRPQRPVTITPADQSPAITVLELLQSPVVDERLTVGTGVAPEFERPSRAVYGPGALGIDLQRRGHEVVKLLFKGFGRKIYSAGYDPEDVIQEVFKGILIRNHGKSPWDAQRSSFGHYVWMVCGCVMSNYHRKQCRRRAVEQIGLPGYDNGRRVAIDVGSCETLWPKGFLPTGGPEEDLAVFDLSTYLQYCRNSSSTEGRLAIRLLPLVHAGYTQTEMAREVGVCKTTVAKALDWLREQALSWAYTP